MLVLLFSLSLSLAAAAADAPPPSIAVFDLKPAQPSDGAVARLASSALVEAVAKRAKDARVLGEAELAGILDQQARSRLAGCEDERCLADLSKIVAADRIVTGRIGIVGGRALVFVSLIDTRSSSVIARASGDIGLGVKEIAAVADALVGAEPKRRFDGLALALLDPASASSGDQRLGELRIAVLFDELDENGAPSLQRPLETCVQQQLLDAGAELLSAAVISKLKGKAMPRDLLKGVIPEALTADEVDVVLAGVAETKLAGEMMSAKKMEVQLSMTLAKIDTGSLLSSESLSAQGLDHAPAPAARKASEKLCAQIAPKIRAALDRRVERGERIVLEVSGPSTAAGAAALAASLEKLKRVAKARPKRVTPQKTTFDLVLAGGDAISLALDLPAELGLEVTEVSAGVLKASM